MVSSNDVTITEHVWEQITNDENPQYACRNCGKQVSGWSKEEGEEMGIPDPCTLIQRRFASNAEDALVLTTRHRYVVLEPFEVAALRAHFVGTPRTVTTVEELNWLPPGSIVRWKSGIAGQRDEFDRFKSTNGNLQPIRHCGMFLPATVLYVPSEGVES